MHKPQKVSRSLELFRADKLPVYTSKVTFSLKYWMRTIKRPDMQIVQMVFEDGTAMTFVGQEACSVLYAIGDTDHAKFGDKYVADMDTEQLTEHYNLIELLKRGHRLDAT